MPCPGLRPAVAGASWRPAVRLAPVLGQWHHRRPALDAMRDLVEDIQKQTPSAPSESAAQVLTSLLSGLNDAGLLVSAGYHPARQSADFRVRGGGAAGTVPPELLIWFVFHVSSRLRVRWEAGQSGSLRLRLSGLKIWPLPNAHEFYRVAGLDGFVCPRIDKSTRKEYYGCHLKKAIMLEELWFSDRDKFPENLQRQFRQLADRELLMRIAHQLGHGFGWSMLLVLSAPPSDIETLEFTQNGVQALTSLDQSIKGWKLAARHHFKDLALDIARPLLGDTRFGGLIREVGERWLRFATNFAVVLSVGEPRWRPRGLKGADSAALAEIFTPRRPRATARGQPVGCVAWGPEKEGRGRDRAHGDAAFGLLPAPDWWTIPQQPAVSIASRGLGVPVTLTLEPAHAAAQPPTTTAAVALLAVAALALPAHRVARMRRRRARHAAVY